MRVPSLGQLGRALPAIGKARSRVTLTGDNRRAQPRISSRAPREKPLRGGLGVDILAPVRLDDRVEHREAALLAVKLFERRDQQFDRLLVAETSRRPAGMILRAVHEGDRVAPASMPPPLHAESGPTGPPGNVLRTQRTLQRDSGRHRPITRQRRQHAEHFLVGRNIRRRRLAQQLAHEGRTRDTTRPQFVEPRQFVVRQPHRDPMWASQECLKSKSTGLGARPAPDRRSFLEAIFVCSPPPLASNRLAPMWPVIIIVVVLVPLLVLAWIRVRQR